jgi:hypothetical protein
MSDSVLMDSRSDLEQPWKSEEPWKQRLDDKLTDLSEVSTNVSVDDEDYNVSSVAEAAQNSDVWCALNCDEVVPQVIFFPSQVYQCAESWWMPAFHENSTAYSQGMQEPFETSDDAFVTNTWAEEQHCALDHCSAEEWRRTAMIRNMPNNYTREMLLELLDSMGFRGSYDFVYLPIDFKTQAGLGYAFVNFVSSSEALRCFAEFEGFCDWRVPSEKVCTVVWGSPYQGLEPHIERYRDSPVMHHSVPDEWKPMLFAQGVRVSFPQPTKAIKAPKMRKQGSAS